MGTCYTEIGRLQRHLANCERQIAFHKEWIEQVDEDNARAEAEGNATCIEENKKWRDAEYGHLRGWEEQRDFLLREIDKLYSAAGYH